jgi:hypothetical protein
MEVIFVMAGLVPAIHVFLLSARRKTWMPGTRPGMTRLELRKRFDGSFAKAQNPCPMAQDLLA